MADEVKLVDLRKLVDQVRAACVEAALNAHEDAAANGLCAEGAWECAVDAMRHLDVAALLPHQDVGDQTSTR
jgi:hypothetical protein